MAEKPKAECLSDIELIEVCLGGDATAFEPLVERYQNFAIALTLVYVPNYHDAQEIVQESFIKAYCNLVQLKNREGFSRWFRSIVINSCYTWLSKSKQSRALVSLDVMDSGGLVDLSLQQHGTEALYISVWDAIYTLPEKYRTVVLLHYMNDYSYDEIARLLDLSVTTVKGRLQQARLKLKGEFQSEEKEMLKMSRVNQQFTKQVQKDVLQIVSESIKETISLGETDHLVLYCGLYRNDIEVRQHDKETVEITGTKYSVGYNKAKVKRSVAAIEVRAKTTENYWKDGPHAVELFRDSLTKNIARFRTANDLWNELRDRLAEVPEPIASVFHSAPQKASWITIGRQKDKDVFVAWEDLTEEVRRIFYHNRESDEGVHGPAGYMSLVVSLPPGKHLTIVNGMFVNISNVRNDIYLLSSYSSIVTLNDVEGTVCLYCGRIIEAKNVRGRLLQHFHQIDGMNPSEPFLLKPSGGPIETKLQQINGELHLDLGKVFVEASEIEAKTCIKNRFGATRFYQTTPRTNPCELQSVSGDVRLFLGEDILGTFNVAASTFCGRIHYGGLTGLGYQWNNSTEFMYVGTLPWRNSERAEIQLQSEAGEIHIEKIPARS